MGLDGSIKPAVVSYLSQKVQQAFVKYSDNKFSEEFFT